MSLAKHNAFRGRSAQESRARAVHAILKTQISDAHLGKAPLVENCCRVASEGERNTFQARGRRMNLNGSRIQARYIRRHLFGFAMRCGTGSQSLDSTECLDFIKKFVRSARGGQMSHKSVCKSVPPSAGMTKAGHRSQGLSAVATNPWLKQ